MQTDVLGEALEQAPAQAKEPEQALEQALEPEPEPEPEDMEALPLALSSAEEERGPPSRPAQVRSVTYFLVAIYRCFSDFQIYTRRLAACSGAAHGWQWRWCAFLAVFDLFLTSF